MKKFDLTISVILLPLDYVMLFLAGIVSYFLRYQELVTQVRPVFFDVSFPVFFRLLALVCLLAIVVFAWSGMYSVRTSIQVTEEFKRVFLAVSTTFLILIITIFLRREVFSSRFIILTAWILAVMFTFLGRWLLYRIKGWILTRGWWAYTLVVLGSGEAADTIVNYYQTEKKLGYKILGRYDHFDNIAREAIQHLISSRAVDEIIQTSTDAASSELDQLIRFCNESHITLRYVASLQQTQLINFEVNNLLGYPVVRIKRTRLEGWGKVTKRLFDIIGSTILLIVLSPLFLVIALAIICDSRGPIVLGLKRVGQRGQPFILYKFRSMIPGADKLKAEILKFNERNDGPLFKMKDDPRITRLGKILRRSSLDELPQLYNVLRGDMSLVGPRPHEPSEVSQYTSDYKKLLTIKPGLTGAAQVSGRSQLRFDQEANLDIYYIENWSLFEDIKILLKTPGAIINYKKVY